MEPTEELYESPPPRTRAIEPMKLLPVMFVSSTIFGLYAIYVTFHCIPRLQIGKREEHLDDAERKQAIMDMVLFHCFTVMLLWCYLKCIISSPGEIPVDDPRWEYVPLDGTTPGPPVIPSNVDLKEMKRTGDRRHCKWCGKYKPDRCHHCRVCRTCVLKMDHHCPWIFNCVGHGNYKFFFLLLLYSVADLHYIVWTMAPSVQRSMLNDTPVATMFFLLFGETLASFMCFILTSFFGFHIWLTLRAMTTIEFCEKSLPSKNAEGGASTYRSSYDQGALSNLATVLGSNPFLMFLPITPSPGDGLSFVNENARLTANQKGTPRSARGPQRTRGSPAGGYGAYGEPDESLDAAYYGYGDQPLQR